MNRRDLAAVVAKDTGIKKSLAEKAVESVLAAIRRNAKRGVQLVGFGSFYCCKETGAQRPQPADRRGIHRKGVQRDQVQAGDGI